VQVRPTTLHYETANDVRPSYIVLTRHIFEHSISIKVGFDVRRRPVDSASCFMCLKVENVFTRAMPDHLQSNTSSIDHYHQPRLSRREH
jgi:hypothetical protein